MERVKTGVPGLDRLIQGGFVKGSVNLATGSTGTGKTIFCSQFINEGLKKGEKCMFITFEESPEEIKKAAKDFGFDFDKYEKKGQLTIEYKKPFSGDEEDLFNFRQEIEITKATRIALDSTSVMSLYFQDTFELRKNLFQMVETIKQTGATALLTTEMPREGNKLTRNEIEEFVVDGVVGFYYTGVGGEESRHTIIYKMRRTHIQPGYFPLQITKKGINISKESTSVLLR